MREPGTRPESIATSEASGRHGGSGELAFTLIETLVALTLLFVLLIGLSTGLLVARRTSEALEARRQVDRLLEASLETLRAGELPVRSGPLPIGLGAGVDFPVALHLEVSPRGLGGLDLVVVRATYLRRGHPVERRLVSQIWSPR
ncbi:MAG TPA: type II secretion system protein [Thermoanaerobaculia bacterium]|nr:type II secretion system protein [Thermoanaerobaculia bacterium]